VSELIETLQFEVLPFGTLLLVAVLFALWYYRRQMNRSAVISVLLLGASGGVLLVAVLWWVHLLPWGMPCLDCLARSPWYSVVLTTLQGWGVASTIALVWWRVVRVRAGSGK